MYCPNCGKELAENAKFCSGCGTKINAAQPAGASFAAEEQPDLRQTGEMQGSGNGKDPRKGKLWWKILLVVVICVAAVVIIFFLIRGGSQNWQVQNHMKAGQNYMEDGDYEEAAAEFQAALEVDPKAVPAYQELAGAYIELDEPDFVESTYNDARQEILTSYVSDDLLDGAEDLYKAAITYYGEKGDSTEVTNLVDEITGMLTDENEAEEIKQLGQTYNEDESNGNAEIEEDVTPVYTYEWVVEPTIEAENIDYVSMDSFSKYPENDTYRQKYSRCSVIDQDGLFGLINLDGEQETEIIYDDIKDVGIPGKDDPTLSNDSVFQLSGGDTHIEEYDGEALFVDWYDETTGEWIYRGDGVAGMAYGYFYIYNGVLYKDSEPASFSKYPIPVKQAAQPSPQSALDMTGNYAVYNNGELVTDFIYDSCGSYSSGLMAVSKDGKWGYVDEKGELVIPIEYDASWTRKDDYQRTHIEDNDEPFCYAATDGYVALVKDGEWELRDAAGDLVVEPGEFEEIRPVYEGKCWAKQDGKWGILQIDTSAEEDVLPEGD